MFSAQKFIHRLVEKYEMTQSLYGHYHSRSQNGVSLFELSVITPTSAIIWIKPYHDETCYIQLRINSRGCRVIGLKHENYFNRATIKNYNIMLRPLILKKELDKIINA